MVETVKKDETYPHDSAQRLMNGIFGVAFLLLIPLGIIYWRFHWIFV